MSLFARVLLTNAGILAAATAALAFTPLTVSFPVALSELLVLGAGLVVMVLLNLALLRRVFAPLERLAANMRAVDPLRPGRRLREVPSEPEVAAVADAFNAMVQRLEDERRDAARASVTSLEAERQRVARELHDEVGQSLTAVMLELDAVARTAPRDLAGDVAAAREQVRSALEFVRAIARRQRPEVIDDLGLAPALRSLAAGLPRSAGISVEVRVLGATAPLSPEAQLAAYRVAQEGLTNALRHADARRVVIELTGDEHRAVLRVRDDGRGFAGHEGAGIRGMRERAVLAGGDLDVESGDHGTTVSLVLPTER